VKLEPSGSQTVGPFFTIGLDYLISNAVPEPAIGAQTITVHGRVLDADGIPVPDAMLELWQADPSGHYTSDQRAAVVNKPTELPGFARLVTDDQGKFRFTTAKPGSVPFPGAVPSLGAVPFGDGRLQAPHIVVLVFMRGLLRHLITRMYFPDEPANATDPVLELVPEDRRNTLIARRDPQSAERLEWNILLQGDEETVFFAW
jgi:protocatechuate 3,4-dioxygenase alpha subunit